MSFRLQIVVAFSNELLIDFLLKCSSRKIVADMLKLNSN